MTFVDYLKDLKNNPKEKIDFDKMLDLSAAALFIDILTFSAPAIITKQPQDSFLIGDFFHYFANEGSVFIQKYASSAYNLYSTGGFSFQESYFDAAVKIVPLTYLESLTLLLILWVPFLAYKWHKNKAYKTIK